MRRRNEARWFIQCAVTAAALSACGGTAAGTDAGHTGVDAGGDAGATSRMLPAAVANGGPAMLSCVGTATQPAAGAAIMIGMDLIAFGQHGDRAPNTQVCFCGNNVLSPEALGATPGTCGACQAVTTDSSGHASVMAQANGWYAYRVFGHMGPTAGTTFLDSVQVNEAAPAAAGGTVSGNAVTFLTQQLITEAELLSRTPGSATIAGRFGDCMGNDLSNAIVRAFNADGSEILQAEDPSLPHFSYFDGMENPDASATYTNTDGLYAIINVPVTGEHETIRVEAWAFTGTGTGEATRIGCEAVEAFTDGVSIVNVGPMRSDYPATHPCHH